jgi:hypothetical protein
LPLAISFFTFQQIPHSKTKCNTWSKYVLLWRKIIHTSAALRGMRYTALYKAVYLGAKLLGAWGARRPPLAVS